MTSSSIMMSRHMLVGELLRKAAHRNPTKVAFLQQGRQVSYKKMENRALKLAGWLQQRGLKKEEKVGFIFKNCIEFIEVFFGVTLSGAVGVPINFRLSKEELVYIIDHSDTKILFIGQEYAETIASIKDNLPKLKEIIVVGNDDPPSNFLSYSSIFQTYQPYTRVESLIDDDPCMIVYTSGTTGRPKGAVLTHKSLLINALTMSWEFRVDYELKQLIVAPLFHVGGIACLLINTFVSGTIVIHCEFEPTRILQTIHEEKVNTIFLAPAMWNFILQVPAREKYDVSSMKRCLIGAAISPLQLKRAIMAFFRNAELFDIFGQTEMSPSTTCLQPEDSLRKTTSVGKPIVNTEIRVVDDNMNDVPIGEVGEIVYRGPGLMKEYYKNPQATEEAFAGGWFHSGDLVRLDSEGFVYVVDRKKDMIISGGENIYPAEVEEVLYMHPAILEAAVIGVPDPNWGESVKAYIVLKESFILSNQEVIDHCKKHLASYKKPKQIEFLSKLPRNSSGKVLKRELLSKYI